MRFLDRMLLERVGDKAVKMCGLLVFISWLSHLIRSGQATGRCQRKLEVGCLRAVHQHSSYSFQSNKLVNVWACTRYEKYPSGIMRFPVPRTRPYINNYINIDLQVRKF